MKPIESTNALDCVKELKALGFNKEFNFKFGLGLVEVGNPNHHYTIQDVKIIEHYRFEGASDPDDMEVVYAIELTDGGKGAIMDAFGTYGNDGLSDFMSKVKEVSERANGY